jgi:hypothetical protein
VPRVSGKSLFSVPTKEPGPVPAMPQPLDCVNSKPGFSIYSALARQLYP